MVDKELIKKAIIYSWAKEGLTEKDVLDGIKNFNKSAGITEGVANTLFYYAPAIAFSAPLVGGALYYTLTNPNIMQKKLYKSLGKTIDSAILEAEKDHGI